MKVTINGYDPESNSVAVTFVHNGVTVTRAVNAVLTDGVYDAEATAALVDDVARGVEHKIDIGVITNYVPPPPPTLE